MVLWKMHTQPAGLFLSQRGPVHKTQKRLPLTSLSISFPRPTQKQTTLQATTDDSTFALKITALLAINMRRPAYSWAFVWGPTLSAARRLVHPGGNSRGTAAAPSRVVEGPRRCGGVPPKLPPSEPCWIRIWIWRIVMAERRDVGEWQSCLQHHTARRCRGRAWGLFLSAAAFSS